MSRPQSRILGKLPTSNRSVESETNEKESSNVHCRSRITKAATTKCYKDGHYKAT
jgi:hypothetical protein